MSDDNKNASERPGRQWKKRGAVILLTALAAGLAAMGVSSGQATAAKDAQRTAADQYEAMARASVANCDIAKLFGAVR